MPIVSAVGVSAQSLSDPAFAAHMEREMAKAVEDCVARGVSIEDDATIKAAILDAISRVRRDAGFSEAD